MNKKRLSILIYSLAGGGAERVTSILLHDLRYKYNITVVLMRNKIDYKIPDDIKIYLLENSKPNESGILKLLKLPYLGWKYKKFCKQNKIDISLALMNRPSYISIFAKIFGNSIKTYISERTTPSVMYKKDNLLSKVNKLLIKFLYPKADFIVTNSYGNRVDLINNFKLNKNIIKTIYNPFDIKNIDKLSKQNINVVDFNKFTFISAGRLESSKNHQLLIKAFSKLKDKNSQLLILGVGSMKNFLEDLIKSLKLEDRVFLLGFDANPYKYFSKSDVFVFTSNFEGFPNVLVEALACGLPVISTDCKSGPREILAPDSDLDFQCSIDLEVTKYGILIPVNSEDKLIKAMKIFQKDKSFSNKYLKQRAMDFEKEKIIKSFIKVLERD